MARYVASVPSPKPSDEVFAYLSDVTNFVEWDPGVESVVQVEGDGVAVGSAYDVVVRGRRPMTLRYRVMDFDPPRRAVLVAETRRLRSEDVISVAPASAGGSVATYDATLKLLGPASVFDVFLAGAFRKIGDRAAGGLRRVLGDGPA